MDSTKFTLSKQAASPLDVTGTPAPADNNTPPYNFVQYGIGRHAANLYNRTFNQPTGGLDGQCVEMPNATCTGTLPAMLDDQTISTVCKVIGGLSTTQLRLDFDINCKCYASFNLLSVDS